MSIIGSVAGMFSSRAKAEALFARAMEKAKNKDTQGAVDDYTAILNFPKAAPSIKAMALFNRALAYSNAGEYEAAKHDLEAVLLSTDVPSNVRAAAKAKQERMRKLAR
jgi:tetratricopeptide (TPR) repeat protein